MNVIYFGLFNKFDHVKKCLKSKLSSNSKISLPGKYLISTLSYASFLTTDFSSCTINMINLMIQMFTF